MNETNLLSDIPTTYSITLTPLEDMLCDRLGGDTRLRSRSALVRAVLAHIRSVPGDAATFRGRAKDIRGGTTFTTSVYVPAQEMYDTHVALDGFITYPGIIQLFRDLLSLASTDEKWRAYFKAAVEAHAEPGRVRVPRLESVLAAIIPAGVYQRVTVYAKAHDLTLKQVLAFLLTSHQELVAWEKSQEPVVVEDVPVA